MTKNNDFKVIVALLALFMVLAVLLGGYRLYNVFGVEKPLINELSELPSVSHVDISQVNKEYQVQVSLAEVDDLQGQYLNIDTIIKERLGNKPYTLDIKDRPNSKLNRLHAYLQPAIYQALANHEFVWLDQHLAQVVKGEDVKYRMFVDKDRLYLQLNDKENYLYVIAWRESETGKTN
ncbi:hypothetical protein [Syntrophomonas erecta]